MNIFFLILTLAIVTGQLIKIPVGINSGVTILDVVVGILCLIGILKTKFSRLLFPLHLQIILLFTAIAIISLVLTPLHLNFSEYLISFFYIVRLFLYTVLALLIYTGALPYFKKNILFVFIFSGVGLAILGILQFIFLPDLLFLTKFGWDPHYFRTVSTFLDPNFAGAYFTLTLILLFQNFINSKKRHILFFEEKISLNIIYTSAFIIVFAALLTTFSRSSYLMFLISGLTISLLKKSKILAFLTLTLFITLLLGFQIYTEMVSIPRHIDRTQSATFRLNTWQQGLSLFQQAPILGVGFNAYRYGLSEFNLGDQLFLNSHGSSSNDSSLLFVASTTGIVGLITYLAFLFFLIKKGIKDNFSIAGAAAGLLIHSFFANSLFYPPILIWLLLISVSPV